MNIKELVKKHFNLVEATDANVEMTFAEVKTADGSIVLTYEGELAAGTPLFVVTPDGNIPAPDGEHMLETGVTVTVKDGMIESIKETVVEEAPAEEVAVEVAAAEEEVVVAEEAPAMEETEAIVEAVAEVVKELVGEMEMKMKEKMAELEAKFNTFAAAPAAGKTVASTSVTKESNSPLESRMAELIKFKKQSKKG